MKIAPSKNAIAIFYLARAADLQSRLKFSRFVNSYLSCEAGEPHDFFIIYKGFESAIEVYKIDKLLSGLNYSEIHVRDERFDLGSYFDAAERVSHEFVGFFNTSSFIQCHHWLAKLARNLRHPDVGMVGATGSFEVPGGIDSPTLRFPNVHLRSNAFLMRRDDFLSAKPAKQITVKEDAYEVEHGVSSLTQTIIRQGKIPLVVGRNGRGYAPEFWPISETFRSGEQANLMVRDNQTEAFRRSPFFAKQQLFALSWKSSEPIRKLATLGFRDRKEGEADC